MFLRKAKRSEPVPVTMSGVRMGERLLQVGIDDVNVAGAIAAKVGLSGSAAAAVPDESAAGRARSSAAEAGVLVDVQVSPADRLPFADNAFDVVVIHSTHGFLGGLDASTRAGAAREWHRVLRPGGRAVTIEAGPRSGFAAMLRGGAAPATDLAAGGLASLEAGGFRPVRVVGELEGYRFTEGLKS
jgi:SAM-dependent methyltransferase